MNFKKLFAATAFAAAVTTAFAVSAFAETTMTATYNKEAGTITIANAPTLNPATLLVLTTDKDGKALTNIGNTDIKQIDEQDKEYTYSTVTVGELAEGTYEVRIGGDGSLTTAMFTVGGADSPYDDPTRLLGDVDNDEHINMADTEGIINHFLKAEELTGDDLQAADTDEDLHVNMADTEEIINYFLKTDTVLGTKTLADREEAIVVE